MPNSQPASAEPFADASARATIYDLPKGQLGHRTATAVFYRGQNGRLGGDLVKIHDVTLHPVKVQPLEALEATHRVFIQPSECRWTYPFARGETRAFTPAALERQIAAAVYHQPDAAKRGAG